MNELQQVLLIFAIIVIAGLYILQKIKAKRNQSAPDSQPEPPVENTRTSADKALNELGEAHIPLSQQTQHRLHMDGEEEEVIPDSQLGLSFGKEFENPNGSADAGRRNTFGNRRA